MAGWLNQPLWHEHAWSSDGLLENTTVNYSLPTLKPDQSPEFWFPVKQADEPDFLNY